LLSLSLSDEESLPLRWLATKGLKCLLPETRGFMGMSKRPLTIGSSEDSEESDESEESWAPWIVLLPRMVLVVLECVVWVLVCDLVWEWDQEWEAAWEWEEEEEECWAPHFQFMFTSWCPPSFAQ